ncbi:DUF2254 domain-containing protein [Corynebacterium pseudodiphtheriticum]|uniref:DUF2254 domain-containing protein n=1 Tax=Corynebacterium pseudodiphtheriticum TaxID=37637 RepID=UPI00234D7608|nr:DUF2254 domain-containing protein [Corynebacterium pseudodiphtheriticum]MDC7089196.1 DUF2254 domain-containing protein [Corynebacterium pseudodiphtheriticum]MDK4322359.1 DUF2254 domain-containing protein [Corynebacterium pseudodiphtheriticum]
MGKILAFVRVIPEQFWFVPALFVTVAIVLSQVLVGLDHIDYEAPAFLHNLLFATGADGARSLLSAVAAFLGVAGTAFSITISVISTASTTYGPRLVRNFMRNRNNQIVLGVLTATFVYTLLVLRTIKSGDDGDDESFIPHMAVNAAIIFGVIDVFVFVWFIHHIASSVQIETISTQACKDFERTIKNTWHDPDDDGVECFPAPTEGGRLVVAHQSGFLTRIDYDMLRRDAESCNVNVSLLARPGDHMVEGAPLAQVWPEQRADAVAKALRDHVHLSASRTTEQDLRFAQQQLVELALRAMAGGTDDPYTAITVFQQITPGIVTAVSRSEDANVLLDDAGAPRVYLRPVTIQEIVDMPFDHVRPHALGFRIVAEALVDLAHHIRANAKDPAIAQRAERHVATILDEAQDQLSARDIKLLREHAQTNFYDAVNAAGPDGSQHT